MLFMWNLMSINLPILRASDYLHPNHVPLSSAAVTVCGKTLIFFMYISGIYLESGHFLSITRKLNTNMWRSKICCAGIIVYFALEFSV